MDNKHLEIAKQAIQQILKIENDPYLFDKNMLVSPELSQCIRFNHILETFHCCLLPPKLKPNNDPYYYLRQNPMAIEHSRVPYQSFFFHNSVIELISDHFTFSVDNFFKKNWRGDPEADFEVAERLIESAFYDILHEVENVHTLESQEFGETLFLEKSRFVIKPFSADHYVCYNLIKAEIDYENEVICTPLSNYKGLHDNIESAMRIIMRLVLQRKIKNFFETIWSEKEYECFLMN